MANSDVALAWSQGKVKSEKNYSTDGNNLYSYQLKIGVTKGKDKILFDYTRSGGAFESRTTSKHVGLARRYASRVQAPE